MDLAHVEEKQDAIQIILKGLKFLDFFHAESVQLQAREKDGKPRLFLHVFGDHLAEKMKL